MSGALTAFLLRHSRTFSLHTVTGVLSVLVHYVTMWALGRTGTTPVAASMAGFLAGAVVKFGLSFQHVFPTDQKWQHSAIRFAVAIGIQAVLNWLLLRTGLRLGLTVWAAQVLTTGLLVVINYVIYRYWVFARAAVPADDGP